MNINDNVTLLYNGALSQKISGKITEIKGQGMRVSFKRWETKKTVECWFNRLYGESFFLPNFYINKQSKTESYFVHAEIVAK